MPNGSTRKHLKKVNNKMMSLVKGSKKNIRLKAIVLDILCEGDSMTTGEIYDIMKTEYHVPNLGSIISLAALLTCMPQINRDGWVKGIAYNNTTSKSMMQWSLRSL